MCLRQEAHQSGFIIFSRIDALRASAHPISTIARLTPAQQQIAQTFIAFFQNKIDFETLQKQITV